MKTTKQTVAHPSLGGGSYKSPEAIVSEIFNEGVLCVSSPENEGWKEETLDW